LKAPSSDTIWGQSTQKPQISLMHPIWKLLLAIAAAASASDCIDGEICDADIPQSAPSLLAKTSQRHQQTVSDDTKRTTQEDNAEGLWDSLSYPNKDILRWDKQGKGDVMVKRWGWLKVPISHEDDGNVYDVKHACLRVRAITAAPTDFWQEKETMFVHCGGPGSGRSCGIGVEPDLLKKYNVLSMNQRGHSIFSDAGEDTEPPVCPFKDDNGNNLNAFPVIRCNELNEAENLKKVPEWMDLKETSQLYVDKIGPAITNGLWRLLGGDEDDIRWAYRLAKLEYNLCYKSKRYEFKNSTTNRISSAFDFTGTTNLAHDMNIFRDAIGARKMTCWGGSYGTQVCSNYATIFPDKTDKLILDGNVEPRPDVISLADEGAEGPMAVFRGIAAACEASLVSDTPEDVCPMAPFMAEKVHKAMRGKNKVVASLVSGVWSSMSGDKDVPCSAVMMSCMSFILKGGPKPAGCSNALGDRIEQALGQASSISTLQIKEMFDELEHNRTKPVSAVLADVIVERDDEHDQEPKYSESVPQDNFGMANIMAVTAMDTHGRLTEEGVIKWWKDAESRFTMGLGRALFFALGVSIWPAVPTPVPPAGDSALKPLIIGNLRDLQTSYLATQRMKQGFPQGHLLTYQGYGHCLGPGWGENMAAEQSCVKHVKAYLHEGVLPEDGSTCAVITTARVGKRYAEGLAAHCPLR